MSALPPWGERTAKGGATRTDNHGGLHTIPASELADWPERKRQIDLEWERRERGEFTAIESLQLARLRALCKMAEE